MMMPGQSADSDLRGSGRTAALTAEVLLRMNSIEL
jgi:hypothetical protein